jgi:hypothetical protein
MKEKKMRVSVEYNIMMLYVNTSYFQVVVHRTRVTIKIISSYYLHSI